MSCRGRHANHRWTHQQDEWLNDGSSKPFKSHEQLRATAEKLLAARLFARRRVAAVTVSTKPDELMRAVQRTIAVPTRHRNFYFKITRMDPGEPIRGGYLSSVRESPGESHQLLRPSIRGGCPAGHERAPGYLKVTPYRMGSR